MIGRHELREAGVRIFRPLALTHRLCRSSNLVENLFGDTQYGCFFCIDFVDGNFRAIVNGGIVEISKTYVTTKAFDGDFDTAYKHSFFSNSTPFEKNHYYKQLIIIPPVVSPTLPDSFANLREAVDQLRKTIGSSVVIHHGDKFNSLENDPYRIFDSDSEDDYGQKIRIDNDGNHHYIEYLGIKSISSLMGLIMFDTPISPQWARYADVVQHNASIPGYIDFADHYECECYGNLLMIKIAQNQIGGSDPSGVIPAHIRGPWSPPAPHSRLRKGLPPNRQTETDQQQEDADVVEIIETRSTRRSEKIVADPVQVIRKHQQSDVQIISKRTPSKRHAKMVKRTQTVLERYKNRRLTSSSESDDEEEPDFDELLRTTEHEKEYVVDDYPSDVVWMSDDSVLESDIDY